MGLRLSESSRVDGRKIHSGSVQRRTRSAALSHRRPVRAICRMARSTISGRIDHQVKIRGFRIELGEIEAVLNQHPGIRESIVVAVTHSSGEKRLAAYLVPCRSRAGLRGEVATASRGNAAGVHGSGGVHDYGRLPVVSQWKGGSPGTACAVVCGKREAGRSPRCGGAAADGHLGKDPRHSPHRCARQLLQSRRPFAHGVTADGGNRKRFLHSPAGIGAVPEPDY